jgi:hypothetical protein
MLRSCDRLALLGLERIGTDMDAAMEPHTDAGEDRWLLEQLRQMPPAHFDASTRSMAAEWFVFYHQKALEAVDEAVMQHVYASLTSDMVQAWLFAASGAVGRV